MKRLIIFDQQISDNMIPKLSIMASDTVFVFSLTSMVTVIDKVVDVIKRYGCGMAIIQSAKEINSSAEGLRDRYINFIAEIPDRVRYKGKNLKELFSIDSFATLWWFSSVSEKNSIESEAFNRLAQLDAVVNVIEREGIKKVLFGCGSKRLKKALAPYLRDNSIGFETLPIHKQELTLKKRIKEHQGFFCLKHLLCLLYAFTCSIVRAQVIKGRARSLKRVTGKGSPLAFVTYYPYFDRAMAKQGLFKNNYYIHLQDGLEKDGRNLAWIAMPVNNASMSFNESLDHFERFVKKGYSIYFLEEFSFIALFMKAIWRMLKNMIRFFLVEKAVSGMHTFGSYNFYPLLKDDWYESFMGERGYRGIVQYYEFRSVLHELKAKEYVYCCEMRAWEKALISARNAIDSKALLFCYQHSAISHMLLNYFNDPKEVADDSGYALPKPDKIVCNGLLSYGYMKESGWTEDRLVVVEAVRYSHLKRYMDVGWKKEKNIVLLAFSTSAVEGSAILNIAYEALKDLDNAEVIIRPHPFLGFGEIIGISGIDPKNFHFQVTNEPLEKVISRAKIVIAGESSVSIEALAAGCEVIIVNVPEWINMSQFRNLETNKVKRVNSSGELREVVKTICEGKRNPKEDSNEVKKIINHFFCLNGKSDEPEKFLTLLKGAK